MTLKKFEKLLDNAKATIAKRIKENPREMDGAKDFFEGYFKQSLLMEIFKSKNDPFHKNARKAFDEWLKTEQEIGYFRFTNEYHDILKQILKEGLK